MKVMRSETLTMLTANVAINSAGFRDTKRS